MNTNLNKNMGVNNINYTRSKIVNNLQKKIDYIQSRKDKPNNFLIEYVQQDNSMSPKVNIGDIVLVNKMKLSYNMQDLFLVMTPNGALIRNLNLISYDTIQLICENSNNENFSIDDVKIIGKIEKLIFQTI